MDAQVSISGLIQIESLVGIHAQNVLQYVRVTWSADLN